MRALALQRYREFEAELGPVLTRFAVDGSACAVSERAGDLHWPKGADEDKEIDELLAEDLTPDSAPGWRRTRPWKT